MKYIVILQLLVVGLGSTDNFITKLVLNNLMKESRCPACPTDKSTKQINELKLQIMKKNPLSGISKRNQNESRVENSEEGNIHDMFGKELTDYR